MLDISFLLLVTILVIFLLMIAILNRLLYIPLFGYMQKRDEEIDRDLKEVSKNSVSVDDIEEEAKTIIENAKSDVSKIRAKIVEDTVNLSQTKIDAKKEELDKHYLDFEKDLAVKKVELKSYIMSQVPIYKEALKAKISKL